MASLFLLEGYQLCLFLQPSSLFAVELQLQLHAGLDFTDCGERAVFYGSHAGYWLHTIRFQFTQSNNAGLARGEPLLVLGYSAEPRPPAAGYLCILCISRTSKREEVLGPGWWRWLEGSEQHELVQAQSFAGCYWLSCFPLAELGEVRLHPWAPMSFWLKSSSSLSENTLLPPKRIAFFPFSMIHTLCLMLGFAGCFSIE